MHATHGEKVKASKYDHRIASFFETVPELYDGLNRIVSVGMSHKRSLRASTQFTMGSKCDVEDESADFGMPFAVNSLWITGSIPLCFRAFRASP